MNSLECDNIQIICAILAQNTLLKKCLPILTKYEPFVQNLASLQRIHKYKNNNKIKFNCEFHFLMKFKLYTEIYVHFKK